MIKNMILIKSMFDPLNMTAFIGSNQELIEFESFENNINNSIHQSNRYQSRNLMKDLFLAYSSEFKLLVRSKSLNVEFDKNNEIDVLFIDYGITDFVNINNIFEMPRDIQNLKCPLPYLQCRIPNIELTKKYFEQEGINFVKETIFNKKLKCKYKESNDNLYDVTIYINMGSHIIPFQDILIGEGFAKSTESLNETSSNLINKNNTQDFSIKPELKFKVSSQDEIMARLTNMIKKPEVKHNEDFEKNIFMKNIDIFPELDYAYDPKNDHDFPNNIYNAIHKNDSKDFQCSYKNSFKPNNLKNNFNHNSAPNIRQNCNPIKPFSYNKSSEYIILSNQDNINQNFNKKLYIHDTKSSLSSSFSDNVGLISRPMSAVDFFYDSPNNNSKNYLFNNLENSSNGSISTDINKIMQDNRKITDLKDSKTISSKSSDRSDAYNFHFPPLQVIENSSILKMNENNINSTNNVKLKIFNDRPNLEDLYIPDSFNPFSGDLKLEFLNVIQDEHSIISELIGVLQKCVTYTCIVKEDLQNFDIVNYCVEVLFNCKHEIVIHFLEIYEDMDYFDKVISFFFTLIKNINEEVIMIFSCLVISSKCWNLSNQNLLNELLQNKFNELLKEENLKNILLLKTFLSEIKSQDIIATKFNWLIDYLKEILFYHNVSRNIKEETLDIFIKIYQDDIISQSVNTDINNRSYHDSKSRNEHEKTSNSIISESFSRVNISEDMQYSKSQTESYFGMKEPCWKCGRVENVVHACI